MQLYRAQWTVNGELNRAVPKPTTDEARRLLPWGDFNASNFRIVPVTDSAAVVSC